MEHNSILERDENGIRRLDLEYDDFPDDGYDYSQHFAERGNGIFILADGTIIQPEDREAEKPNIVCDIPDDIDPEILAMLNGEIEGDELDDDFLEKALGNAPMKAGESIELYEKENRNEMKKQMKAKKTKQTKEINEMKERKEDEMNEEEFERTLKMWEDGEDDENEINDYDIDDDEFEEEMNDIIDENILFKNGNPLDNIDFSKAFIEFDDNDVDIVMNSIDPSYNQKKKKRTNISKKEMRITKEDLQIDPKILMQQVERMEREEEEDEKETVVVRSYVKEDIQQQRNASKPVTKPKNKPKMVKAPAKKKKK